MDTAGASGIRLDVELKALEYLLTELLLAVMPEAEALVHSAQLWPSANTVQAKKLKPLLARQVARVTEKDLGVSMALPLRADRDLVNECGGSGWDLRPEERILKLKPEHADHAVFVGGHVVHPISNVSSHSKFTDFPRVPQCFTPFAELLPGGLQHAGDDCGFGDQGRTNSHGRSIAS